MEKILEIIKDRILLAEKKKGEASTDEMEAFWDGQLHCAQFLLNEVARLTMRAADEPSASCNCESCSSMLLPHELD